MSGNPIATLACPSCSGTTTQAFFHIASTPVTCTSIFDSAQEARAIDTGPVDLVVCAECGLIYNRSFDAARAQIGARYESSQAASAHFNAFARQLATTWIERHRLAGRTVMEIGSGSGDFLRLLLEQGVGRGIGIDPLADAVQPLPPAMEVLTRSFDDSTLAVAADAAVCRHTLEHVPDVHGFLRSVASWAVRDEGRVVLFELPATERLLEERAFWDVYYEHCNYFTRTSLVQAFERAGLEVIRCEHAYSGQYLLLEARAAPVARDAAPMPDTGDLQRQCDEFGHDVRAAVRHCEDRLAQMAAPGAPVVLWQGAAKTVGFLAAVRSDGLVHSAVDLNERRQGRYLPGTGLPVIAPDALRALRPAHVVLMNPVYRDEVQAALSRLGVDAQLSTVVDLCRSHAAAAPTSPN